MFTGSRSGTHPRNTVGTVDAEHYVNQSLVCRSGKFLAGALNDVLKFNVHRFGDPQHCFERWIPHPTFYVSDHLGRQTRCLSDIIFGQLASLTLFLKYGNGFNA